MQSNPSDLGKLVECTNVQVLYNIAVQNKTRRQGCLSLKQWSPVVSLVKREHIAAPGILPDYNNSSKNNKRKIGGEKTLRNQKNFC